MTLPSTLNPCAEPTDTSSGGGTEADLLQELLLGPDANNNHATRSDSSCAVAVEDEDADMFGPPRSAPLLHSNRPRVPMISAKLRLREERKRVLQLCAHKLEKIKDSETNLRRSVCINNTYARLTEEVRREKQSRYLANLPKWDSRNRITNLTESQSNNDRVGRCCRLTIPNQSTGSCFNKNCRPEEDEREARDKTPEGDPRVPPLHGDATGALKEPIDRPSTPANPPPRRRSQVESDLEALDREIAAINETMPPIDPEITQGAEQLEKAVVTRKRKRMEASLENDRLFALSEFYFPSSPLPSEPLEATAVGGSGSEEALSKRPRLMGPGMSFDSAMVDLDLNLDHQSQRDFDMIMETLRLTMVDIDYKPPPAFWRIWC